MASRVDQHTSLTITDERLKENQGLTVEQAHEAKKRCKYESGRTAVSVGEAPHKSVI